MSDAAQNIEVPIFGQITRKIKSLRTVLTAIGKMAQGYIVENFQTEGSRLGTPWLILSPRYAARKKKEYGNKTILVRNQRLLNSITGNTPQVGENSVTIGTEVPYAAIHHFGGDIIQPPRSEIFIRNRHTGGINYEDDKLEGRFKKGKKAGKGFTYRTRVIHMPARPFMQITREDTAEIGQSVSDYLFRK